MNRKFKRSAVVILIALIIIIPLLLTSAWGMQFADEVYSLLQVARALAGESGVIFSYGSSVASPSIFFTWLVSIAARLFPESGSGLDAAAAAAFLSALGWSSTALAFLAIGKSINRLPGSAVAALLLCFNPIIITFAGSPASWIVALTWWVAALLLKRRYALLFAALIVLLLLITPLPPGFPVAQTGLLDAFVWSLLVFLLGLAAEFVARWLAANMKPDIDSQLVFRLALVAILLLAGLYQLSNLYNLYQARPQARWVLEADAAAWLNDNTTPTAVIGASEKIGYLANRRAVALDPLVAGETAQALQVYLPAQPVDYLLSSAAMPWQLLDNWRWFQLNYRPLAELDDPYVSDAPYTIWAYQPPPEELGFAHALNARVPNRLRILGYQVDQADLVRANEAVLTLYLEAVEHTINSTMSFLIKTRLISPLDGETLVEWDNQVPIMINPQDWQPGERIRPDVVTEQITIEVPAGLEPGAYPLNISLADSDSAEFWPISLDNDIERLDRLQVGYVVVPTAVDEAAIQAREATFGDQVKLLGYTASDPQPGEDWELTLFWQVDEPLGDAVPSLNVFTHILNNSGQLVANHDSIPANGRYPTPSWIPGVLIADSHSIPLAPDLPPGSYDVHIGIYEPQSGNRLPATGGDGKFYPEGSFPLTGISLDDTQ